MSKPKGWPTIAELQRAAREATYDPIRVRCEGSGAIGHVQGDYSASPICPRCGRKPGRVPLTDRLIEHDRDDIIAMLERGDFG